MNSVTTISTMMGKRNLIHRFSLLLLILVPTCISAEHYHIVPNDSTSQCQNYSAGTCFTLAEFASNISHLDLSNHLTLSFLQGEHLLTKRLAITGPQNITLTGQNSSNSSIIKCQGSSGFEFEDIQSLNVEYLEFTGCGNVSCGGAISINRVDMFIIKGCHFIDNHVTLEGGAVLVNNTVTMNIEDSLFNNNSASGNAGGAICVINGSIFTINSIYMNNSAYAGGAIYIESGNVSSIRDYYINNTAEIGGAIFVDFGNIYSTSDHYVNNTADRSGGAIYVYSGNITSTSDQYINNSADSDGGAIYVYSGNNIISTNDHYINNSADSDGGAIYINSGNIYSTNDYCINNSADRAGGAIFVFLGDIYSTNDYYINNSAVYGGAIYMESGSCNLNNDSFTLNTAAAGALIYKDGGILKICQTNITNNFARYKGSLFLKSVTLMIAEGVNFMNNHGSLYVSSTKVQINGAAVFMNNLGDFGGAITAIEQSQIIFDTASMVTISNNTATYGGGIYLAQSNLHVYQPFELTGNKASEYGGGIYASRSVIEFKSEQTQTLQFTNNTALNGGAI